MFVESTPGTYVPPGAIPDVIGFGSGQARSDMEKLGFTVKAEAVAAPAGSLRKDGLPFEAGQVWQTTPAAGAASGDGVVVLSYQVASAAPPTTAAPATGAGTTTTVARRTTTTRN